MGERESEGGGVELVGERRELVRHHEISLRVNQGLLVKRCRLNGAAAV